MCFSLLSVNALKYEDGRSHGDYYKGKKLIVIYCIKSPVLGKQYEWTTIKLNRFSFLKHFLAFIFYRFCMGICCFFINATTANDLKLRKNIYHRCYPSHFCPILILQKEPVFPYLMLSAKQGNPWYHFYNVFGMMPSMTGDWTRDLPHSKPALYH